MAAQRSVWRFSSFPMAKVEQLPPSTASLNSTFGTKLSSSLKRTTAAASSTNTQTTRKLPILLFDIMDTIVRDPFYDDIPDFFGMSMKELLECKHPTAWIEFEKGLKNEMELAQMFFKDGRPIDLEGLKSCMRQGYSYIEGVEELLIDLKGNGYEMHTSTNYPIWYEIIEEKLKLSTYLSWTFCSCIMVLVECAISGKAGRSECYLETRINIDEGKRKPDPDFYMDILKHLNVEPNCCVFIDDRMRNVEAARDVGMVGIHFKTVISLREDLSHLGIAVNTN